MDGFLCVNFLNSYCKNYRVLLAAAWIAGLLTGALLALSAYTSVAQLIISIPFSNLSIYGLLSALIFPLILTLLAVCTARRWLLFAVSAFKAFCFSYTWICILMSFRSSGWLLCAFILCSDLLALPLLWWLWLRFDSLGRCSYYPCCLSVAGMILIGCIYYAFIVPYFAHLIFL